MNQDALERLRSRAKPKVESRDLSTASLVSNDEKSSLDQLTINPERPDISNSSSLDVQISTAKDADTISPSSTPAGGELSPSSMELKTKQSTIRLEQELSQKLSHKCQSEEISREVFLEALFVYFENHKSIQSKVLLEARKRDQQRQKIANYRRAKSMIERFGSD